MGVVELGSFKEFISDEIHLADASLPAEIKNYLVDLLFFYLFTDRLFEYKKDRKSHYEETFTELCSELQEVKFHRKVYLLKKMGDLSLYTSGYFRASINRKIIDLSYYETIGERAYRNLANLYDEKNIFNVLSCEFKNVSGVLFYIQRKLGLQKNQNYLGLYEEYTKSKGNPILKRLMEEEVIIPKKNRKESE